MDQSPVSELVLPAPNESEHDDDAEIEDLLSSFYFDNSDKSYATSSTQSTHGISRHRIMSANIEHLNPIYEEDEMLYDLYGEEAEQEDQLPSSPSYGSSNSDESDDEDSSSSSPDTIALPYDPTLNVIHVVNDPSRFWPVIEEDEDDGSLNATITITASRSPPQILLEEKERGMQEEDDDGEESIEWEQRGRSRAVPTRLVRWATKRAGENADREVSWIHPS